MENRKNLKYGITALAYVLGVALFFVIGYNTGRVRGKQDMEEMIAASDEPVIQSSAISGAYERTEYEIKLKDNVLGFYEVSGEEVKAISEVKISESVYPDEDIQELKRGLVFFDKHEAQMMFENFIS